MLVKSLVPESEERERERERVFNQLSTSCCFSPFHACLYFLSICIKSFKEFAGFWRTGHEALNPPHPTRGPKKQSLWSPYQWNIVVSGASDSVDCNTGSLHAESLKNKPLHCFAKCLTSLACGSGWHEKQQGIDEKGKWSFVMQSLHDGNTKWHVTESRKRRVLIVFHTEKMKTCMWDCTRNTSRTIQ